MIRARSGRPQSVDCRYVGRAPGRYALRMLTISSSQREPGAVLMFHSTTGTRGDDLFRTGRFDHAPAAAERSGAAGNPVNFQILWRPYLAVTAPIIVLLSGLGALALYSTFFLGHGSVYGLVPLFLLNAEENIPTLFSSANLAFCSLLLLVAGAGARHSGRPFATAWIVLGLAALYVAIDESVQIHELLDRHTQWTEGLFEAQGPLQGPWVVVYGAIALAFALGFARFFLHLPGRYRLLLSAGAVLFVGASIGLEMVGADMLSRSGKTLGYELVNWAEEVLEMSAVMLVNASLLSYLQTTYGPLTIRLG